MFKRAAVLAGCALLFGCGVDLESENQEIVANLVQAGFPADDIMISSDGLVYVGRDTHVTLAASREMLQPSDWDMEQYRTTNLVGSSVTKICIVPTTTFNKYSTLVAGLDGAIAKYNAQNLQFTMVKGNPGGCSAIINAKTLNGTVGGSSGFPSGGLPYGTINIGTGLKSYSIAVNTHVIMHELGHCIGFRHSDYYNRAISCGGTATNEGDAGVGAILIPGTPSTAVVGGSVMNSCFRSTETGNWTSTDITALQYLY
jgi:hypothetical protein